MQRTMSKGLPGRGGELTRRELLAAALSGGSALLLAACTPSTPAAAPTSAAPAPTSAQPPAAPSRAASTTAAASPVPAAKPAVTPSAAASPAASLTSVTVSQAQVSGSFLPDYVALDGGIFRKNGLDVKLTVGQSNTTMAALLAGQVNIGQTGGPELLNAIAGGADLVAVATLVPVYPYRLFATKDIQKPSDLKGKKIGITNFGSTIDLATRLALTKLGVNPSDVTFVPLSTVAARTAAMLSGQIAAGLSQPPDWIKLEAAGLHSILDLASSGIQTATVTAIVQRSYLTAERSVVQRFVDSLVSAIAREKHDPTFTTAELQKILKYNDPNGLKATYQFYSQNVHPALPYPDVAQLQVAYDQGKQKNPKMASVDLAKVVDRSFVQNAADRGLQNAS